MANHLSSVPASVDENTRALLGVSMKLAQSQWDEDVKLVRNPSPHYTAWRYLVRESSWYALALLLRDQPGDRERAEAILDVVLKQQYLTSGVPWYGTFRRSPEEHVPPAKSEMWRDYDPNWREFIGSTFALILIEYPDRISPQLAKRMYSAIDRAVKGEYQEGRLLPSYSNIALLYAFLLDFAAEHDRRRDWKEKAIAWRERVYGLFKKNNTFYEYNSSTYYGVDLYGLALWRSFGSTKEMRAMGSQMESQLWEDVADYYHPGLKNLAGPYDRAYGMDMTNYVSLLGMWMRTRMDAEQAPLPIVTNKTDHVADIWFAPHIAILGARIPADALDKLQHFQGEHRVYRKIEGSRIATAWVGKDAIYGGEITGKTKDAGPSSQFHPATIHWRMPSGELGWVQLLQSPMVDVEADEHGLTVTASGTIRLRIHADHIADGKIEADNWKLPGLRVRVASDANAFHVEPSSEGTDLVYSRMTRMRLDVRTTP